MGYLKCQDLNMVDVDRLKAWDHSCLLPGVILRHI